MFIPLYFLIEQMVKPEYLNPEEKALRSEGLAMFQFLFDFHSHVIFFLKSVPPGAAQWIHHMVYGVLFYLVGRITSRVRANC